MCAALVLFGTETTWSGAASGDIHAHRRIQANIRCPERMYEAETDVPVSNVLFPHVSYMSFHGSAAMLTKMQG